MYNFDLLKGEKLIEIFENAWISQGDNEKNTTIALTNKRLLFLDYDKNDPREDLRVARGVDYMRYKEIYYSLDLKDIVRVIDEKDCYIIDIGSNKIFFEDEKLFKLLKKKD